jgi:hypothetical protein
MSIAQRRHNRLAVDLPAFRITSDGEKLETLIYQIGVGGCLIAWDESISKGDRFRMEVQLPNLNWLPLQCKAVYCFTEDAVGVQFENICKFEQDLLVEIMSNKLTRDGIPFDFDPFSPPKTFRSEGADSEREGVHINESLIA